MLQESPRVTYTVSFTVFTATLPKDRGGMRGMGTQTEQTCVCSIPI